MLNVPIPIPLNWTIPAPENITILDPLATQLKSSTHGDWTRINSSIINQYSSTPYAKVIHIPESGITCLLRGLFYICDSQAFRRLNSTPSSLCYVGFHSPPLTIYTETQLLQQVLPSQQPPIHCLSKCTLPVLLLLIRASILVGIGTGGAGISTSTHFYDSLSLS